jgi:CheY-like chemotaxis protein
LHIEDDSGIADVLRIALTGEGYEVVKAPSGTSGLDMVYQVLPHVVLLDINMPIMSGFNVLEALRAHSALRERPIICVTAMTSRDDVERAFELGCYGYVFKPVNLHILTALIQYYTEGGSEEVKMSALLGEQAFARAALAVDSGVDDLLKLETIRVLQRAAQGADAGMLAEVLSSTTDRVRIASDELVEAGMFAKGPTGRYALNEDPAVAEKIEKITLVARNEDTKVAFVNLAYLGILQD